MSRRENHDPTQPRYEQHQLAVQAILLRRRAERGVQAGRDQRGWSARLAVVQKERARRNARHAQHPLQRLPEDLLNFAARETRRRQVQIRERQHVVLDAPLLFLVQQHHHQHRREKFRNQCERADGSAPAICDVSELRHVHGGPGHKRERNQQVRQRLLTAALLREHPADSAQHERNAIFRRDVDRFQMIGGDPHREGRARHDQRPYPGLFLAVKLRRTEKEQRPRRHEPFVERHLPRRHGDPRAERRTQRVQRDESPRRRPQHQVRLPLGALNVCEKRGRQRRGHKHRYR